MLSLEVLEDRSLPAALVWLGDVDSDFQNKQNWREYTPSTDTVGSVPTTVPSFNDDLYINYRGQRDCIVYDDTLLHCAATMKVTNDFTKDLRVAGDLVLFGGTSFFNDDIVLRTSGRIQFGEGNTIFMSQVLKDVIDTTTGIMYIAYNGNVTINSGLSAGVPVGFASRIIVGDYFQATGANATPSYGTLKLNIGNSDLDFKHGSTIDVKTNGKLKVDASFDRVLKGGDGLNGITNYGTMTIEGTVMFDITMPTRNLGGVFRMYDDTQVHFNYMDNLGGSFYSNGGVVSMGNNVVMRLYNYGGTFYAQNTNLETYVSGNVQNITPVIEGHAYLHSSTVTGNSYRGEWIAYTWRLDNSSFYTRADTSADDAFVLSAVSNIICNNLSIYVDFYGPVADLVIGAEWALLVSVTGPVGTATVYPDTAAPTGMAWYTYQKDRDLNMMMDSFNLKLVEVLPPPLDPPMP